jgi:hypothetical protein
LRAARVLAILFVLLLFSGVLPVLAAKDTRPPTKPGNLRVTALTAHNVTLAWNPSTDNSGSFSYKVWVSYGFTHTVPQSQTTFSLSLVPNNTYSFYVYAVDGSGNKSSKSNTVTVTTPPDTTPPTAPVLSLVGVNPTEISLEWTAATDDGLHLMYQVYVNGSLNVDAGTARSAVVHNLAPETTYTITVRARDLYGNNLSEPSNALTVTTAAINPNDTEPPPPPANFYALDISDCAEVWLFWTQSFDNQTPQAAIHYDIYVNGVFDQTIIGDDEAITYALLDENTLTIIAKDSAGNTSAPVNATVTLC